MSEVSKPVVLVDLDGVCADFDKKVLEIAHKEIPNFEQVPRQHFYISDDYPDLREIIDEIYEREGFFISLDLVENTIEGWHRLTDLGYDPVVCTAPLTGNPYCVLEKRLWIEEHLAPHFGQQVVDRAIIDKHKYKYYGLALIDNSHGIDDRVATWSHILFNTEDNSTKPAELRLQGWLDPNLERLLNHCRILAEIGKSALRYD